MQFAYSYECQLHDGLEGESYYVDEIVQPYFYPYEVSFMDIKPETLKLMMFTAKYEGMWSENDPFSELMGYYDDFKVFRIKLNIEIGNVPENIIVVSYGVGGGNGGYLYIDESNYEVLSSTFDGDQLECDQRFAIQ